tara:strand:+ start:834 stop:1421 length:588 start_codon:yes stop_codon:yes gene_type:complete
MPNQQRNNQKNNKRNPRKKRKYKKWKEPKKERSIFWKSEYVVGSKEWVNQVYQLKPKRKVSKETREMKEFLKSLSQEEYDLYMKNTPIKPKQKKRFVDHQNMAERLGWVFSPETKTWNHPTYKNKEFKSLVEVINGYRYYSPYAEDSDEDPKGLAFNFELSVYPNEISVYQNIWKLENIHTRNGKRREGFRKNNL